jgi:hypothetical protein
MQFKRAPLFKLAACIAILSFLMGVVTAGAVERDERVSKDPRQVHKPFHFKSVGAGKHQGLPSFMKSAGGVACESDCCWAWAECDGAQVECSEFYCGAFCEDGRSAEYVCEAN